jgi:hypothetical protein
MAFDNSSVGALGASRFSGQRGRTADGTGRSGIRYPSPFFDIGHTYLPPTMKALMRWCRYYYLVNPLINTVIHKMSEYPITEIVIDEKNAAIKEKWERILGTHLRYRAFQIEVGLDYYTYGMCIVTIHFPFDKYLVCRNCKYEDKAKNLFYRWRNLEYIIVCDKCHQEGPAIIKDAQVQDVRRIKLQRWNPEYVNVDTGFAGSDPTYTFELPLQVKNDILLGKKNVLDTIPDIFIEAIRRGKFIKFSPENVFVFKRPIISQKDEGWGMPLIMPVLKDVFYLQILRKAQEMIAQEHIVPLRILFPQAGGNTSDPYSTISLEQWKGKIENEIAKWKYDQNYIPILPLPVGNQTFGGDGKALGLYQEMEIWNQHIVAGMGVPQEFIFGGLQYSGSNVSMRMLENMFIGYRNDHENMLNEFTIKRISHFMGWPAVRAHMRRFKMADDLQRTAFFFQLNQAQKISDRTMLLEADFDPVVEEEQKKAELNKQIEWMRKQQVAQAAIQGEVMAIQSKYQTQIAMDQAAKGLTPDMMGGAGAAGGKGAPKGPAGPSGPSGDTSPTAPNGMMPTSPAGPDGKGGKQGAMMSGPEAAPGMPDGSTVSSEEGMLPPEEGIPQQMQSPITMGLKGGGFNLLYLARRAATNLEGLDDMSRNSALEKMKMSNPQLYMLVLQMLQSAKGSQRNPLDPLQSPSPEIKPPRSPKPVE